MPTHTVLLFYKYVSISDPEDVIAWQRELCESLNLKGRILIADEGINGTVAGVTEATQKYIEQTTQDARFSDIEWKTSPADEQVFPRLSIKLRPEIVTLGQRKQGNDVALENKAHYIEPEELLKLYENDEDFIILDARNEYEARIGKFKDAVVPPIDNFREFPKFAKTIESYKDKEVVTYCTGGIRCEKASAYLREQGFKKVRQLHGGVHVYAEKTGGKHFEGELFVFDKRLHMKVNEVNPSIISNCEHCGAKSAMYIDCPVKGCPELFISCEACQEKHQSHCTHHANVMTSQSAESVVSTSNKLT